MLNIYAGWIGFLLGCVFGAIQGLFFHKPDWLGVKHSAKTVADYFDISIGPVVPYRDKQTGPTSPYIHPKQLPLWAEIKDSDIEGCPSTASRDYYFKGIGIKKVRNHLHG